MSVESGDGIRIAGGERRGRFDGKCEGGECGRERERGDVGRGGCEFSASERRGAFALSNKPSRLPCGRSFNRSLISSSCPSCWLISCSDLVGELAVEIDMALEESESDSSLILVLSGRRTWCCGTALLTLMLPVDLENGDSSIGVEALSLVIDEGESKENDCERMRTFGLGVRGGAEKSAAIMNAGTKQRTGILERED